LKAHGTAASLLKKGMFPDVSDAPVACSAEFAGRPQLGRLLPDSFPCRYLSAGFQAMRVA